jgi:uncharacterized protein (DUF1499 family)
VLRGRPARPRRPGGFSANFIPGTTLPFYTEQPTWGSARPGPWIADAAEYRALPLASPDFSVPGAGPHGLKRQYHATMCAGTSHCRVTMGLRKALLILAPALSVAALLILALAPFGTLLGWWHYGFALYRMMPASGVVAALSVVIAASTLALRWAVLSWRARAALSLALVLGAALVYLPLQYRYIRGTVPPINDITTDTDDPPAFQALLPARAHEDAKSAYDQQVAGKQRAAYPDLVPLETPLPAAAAFQEALHVARSMPNWLVVDADAGAGRIEASVQSRWFRFTDDVVIRIKPIEGGGSRVDVRSASRRGTSDYGVNAARVRTYMGLLRKRLG